MKPQVYQYLNLSKTIKTQKNYRHITLSSCVSKTLEKNDKCPFDLVLRNQKNYNRIPILFQKPKKPYGSPDSIRNSNQRGFY